MRPHVAALTWLCLASLPAPVFAATNCPADTILLYVFNPTTITSTNPTGSYGQSGSCAFAGGKSGSVGYNLTSGTFSITVSAGFECGAEVRLTTHDTFTLTGPAYPSALTFKAHLAESVGGNNGGGQVSLSVGDAVGVHGPDFDIAVSITKSVGESFDLSMFGDAVASAGYAYADGNLSFSDLPPGYEVVSCQGFVGSSPVPVVPMSWGHIKTIYR